MANYKSGMKMQMGSKQKNTPSNFSGSAFKMITGEEPSSDFFENIDLRVYLRDVEVVLIESALKKSDGVVSKASDLLKINRTTLIEKMKKLQIN